MKSHASIARRLSVAALVVPLGAACGGGDPSVSESPSSFPADPYVTATSESGRLVAELRTSPEQPPVHGVLSVELTLRDAATGAPKDGLAVELVPWMLAMGHGSSVKPEVAATGGGRYVASRVDVFMPGRWELRTTVRGDTIDHLAPVLDVP
jgi:hypothetical protein